MSAIYELKNQIYTEISNITYKIFFNNKDTDYFFQEENNLNECLVKQSRVEDQFDLILDIKEIKLGQSDIKNYFYGIGFELYLSINNNYNCDEKVVYNILERILKLLSTMEFYYCYKLNNQDIKSKVIVQTPNLKEAKLKINWITNLHLNNNIYN